MCLDRHYSVLPREAVQRALRSWYCEFSELWSIRFSLYKSGLRFALYRSGLHGQAWAKFPFKLGVSISKGFRQQKPSWRLVTNNTKQLLIGHQWQRSQCIKASWWLCTRSYFVETFLVRNPTYSSLVYSPDYRGYQKYFRAISLLIAGAVFALCIPTLLAHDIQPQIPHESRATTTDGFHLNILDDTDSPEPVKYSIGFSKMVTKNNCLLLKLNLWLIGIMLKVSELNFWNVKFSKISSFLAGTAIADPIQSHFLVPTIHSSKIRASLKHINQSNCQY